MTDDKRKTRLQEIKQQHKDLYAEEAELIKNCKHHIVCKNDSAICDICEQHFGWYCPNSPNHQCEYTEQSGDECIHCKQPDERK